MKKTREKKIDLQMAVLIAIASVGLLSMAVLAPNALQCLKIFDDRKNRYRRISYINKNVVKKLLIRGFIKIEKGNAKLTPKGRVFLTKYELKEKEIPKPKKWDGKYRLVMFDIKEWKRGSRDELRNWLTDLGFVRLQNSVWVYPYDCEDIVALLKTEFNIGHEVLYLRADYLENDKWLKEHFGLQTRTEKIVTDLSILNGRE